VKNGDVDSHLKLLETRADNGGFTNHEFSQLCSVLQEKSMAPMLCRRFISSLVPSQPVPGPVLADLIIWAVGDESHNKRYLVHPVLHIVDLCLEYDLVENRSPLVQIYELFLSLLPLPIFHEVISDILAKLTTSADIDSRRVQKIRECCSNGYNLSGLRWVLRQLRPDLEPNCPPPAARSSNNTVLCRRFRAVFAQGVDKILSGLGWEPGQLASKVVFKDGQKQTLLPSVETLNLEGGLDSKKDQRYPLQSFNTLEEAYDQLENIKLPNNILSILSSNLAANILPRKELIERFSLVLFHTLQNEFLTLSKPRSKTETARREKRQLRFLEILRDFQTFCHNGLPVVGRFLSEYLDDWDGKQFFNEILGLLKLIQITEFKELYDTVLAQLWKHFLDYSLINKLLVLEAYFQLLKYWGTVEYPRLTHMKIGLFPDGSANCDNALLSIVELVAHINEITVVALRGALEEQSPAINVFIHHITNMYIHTQEIFVKLKVPVRLQIPQSLVLEHIFTFSPVAFSKMCKYAISQKNTVLPLLKESIIFHETLGDTKTATVIKGQLSPDSLKSLESVTRDILLVVSPTVVSRMEDSLDTGLDITKHFISNHPAFLPLTVKYFSESSYDLSVAQDIFAGLTSDRRYCDDQGSDMFSEISSHRMSLSVFYKSRPSSIARVSNPDLDSFLEYIGCNLPDLGDFIRLFCYPPKPTMSIASRFTELTESSGVSSFEPKAVKKKRLARLKESEEETRRVSPRGGGGGAAASPRGASKELKRKSDSRDANSSKRTVLAEIN